MSGDGGRIGSGQFALVALLYTILQSNRRLGRTPSFSCAEDLAAVLRSAATERGDGSAGIKRFEAIADRTAGRGAESAHPCRVGLQIGHVRTQQPEYVICAVFFAHAPRRLPV